MIPEVARLSRRGVVGVAAAGALTGCSGGGKAPAPRRPPAPGAAARARAAADSLTLLRRYDAVASAHPGLAVRLAPLRAEVARHAQAFGVRPPGAPAVPPGSASPRSAPPGPAPARSASAPARPSAPPVPGVPAAPRAALSWLAAAERALADRRAAALAAAPGDLARLLASVSAAGAGHVVLLTAPTDRTEDS
ncbi:hypothetical protein V2S66_02925 [Streptomyces sp. V4-01]|uniref:Lipoprotein n=1 Tax=Actinacidiphila polyblastidii TaxID=3110430 RepID=A0ABU7P532_9ACTN|nr:hypothetical protein [Streptomyces sp. V4-01]